MKSSLELYKTLVGLRMEIGYRLMEIGRMRPPFLYPVKTTGTVWNFLQHSSVIELAPSYKINKLIFKRRYM